MPSFQDSAFIILLGLLLFGPKGLAGIARQVGKLMGEFRRASADFRMQMEDELRISEQAEQQKKIAAMEAAAPVTPLLHADMPEPEHPHSDSYAAGDSTAEMTVGENRIHEADAAAVAEPLPIASSGDLDLMPPATGLPVGRSSGSSVGGAFDAVPHVADPEAEVRAEEHQEANQADLIDNVRANVADRADLPGMTLMEHLDELRKRLIRAVIALLCGFGVAYLFHVRLFGYIQKPLNDLGMKLAFTHPTDPLNLYIKTALVGGAIIASPFILYQLWLFISPGMYAHEKRYVWPFMGSTVGLFLAGAWFGYRYILPGALSTLINGFGKGFQPIITIEDYTGFFLAIILGLGITFELPILIFFLSLFGIVDARFLLKHIRYAILIIFLITAIICPLPDPISMCIFASPMLVLYALGVVIAVFVHPDRRKAKELKAS